MTDDKREFASSSTGDRRGAIGLRIPHIALRARNSRTKTRPRLNIRGRLLSLKGPERKLSDAIEQIRQGVPLNWSQMEDDPEIATLSYVQDVAAECTGRAVGDVPTALKQSILDDLSKRLPSPRQITVKLAPKTLAGFSENVPVVTQADESVPELISRAPQIAGAIALAIGLVAVVWWGIAFIQKQSAPVLPVYSWIEVRQGATVLTRVEKPENFTAPICRNYKFTDPAAKRNYVSIPDTQQIQRNVGFPIDFLPRTLALDPPTSTVAYALDLSDMSVASCEEDFSADDRGASVKVAYEAKVDAPDGSIVTGTLAIFQIRQHPTTLDTGDTGWKEVHIGKAHGVYWQGSSYRDMAGTVWTGDVGVLLVERGDSVLTLVGQASPVITEGFLTEAVATISRERDAEENLNTQPFTWIEVSRGTQVIVAKKPPDAWKPLDCFGQNQPTTFQASGNLDNAQASVGYPIKTLPTSVPGSSVISRQAPGQSTTVPPITSTISSTIGVTATPATLYALNLQDEAVLSCSKQPGDPDAKVKLRYGVRLLEEIPAPAGGKPANPIFQDTNSTTVSDIIMFQEMREPASLSVEGGQWKEVKVGDARGVYWSGSQYHDMEGQFWEDGANVLILEKGNVVVTLESRASPEALLIALAEKIDWSGTR